MTIKARHDECTSCAHHDPNKIVAWCLKCGAGEFFEEKLIEDTFVELSSFRLLSGKNDEEG